MAYGQTGSGKTYSMLGSDLERVSMERGFSQDVYSSESSQGLIPRTVHEVFRYVLLASRERSFLKYTFCFLQLK